MSSLKNVLGAAVDLAIIGGTRFIPINTLTRLGASLGRKESHKSKKARRAEMTEVSHILFPDMSASDIEAMGDRNWSFIGETMLKIANL